jgi:tRNA-specific adenosine deaminase 1
MWQAVADLASALSLNQLTEVSNHPSYHQFKEAALFTERRRVKVDVLETALKGWVKNGGDEDFSLSIDGPHK